jgi:DNA-directed RNA polymerase specialized sigma24 family protein
MTLDAAHVERPFVDPNWNELIESTGPLVHRIAWRILGHPQDAEDTVQDVFLRSIGYGRGENHKTGGHS